MVTGADGTGSAVFERTEEEEVTDSGVPGIEAKTLGKAKL